MEVKTDQSVFGIWGGDGGGVGGYTKCIIVLLRKSKLSEKKREEC